MTCPDHDQLLAFCTGELSEPEAEKAIAHIGECRECQAALNTFSRAEDTLAAVLRSPMPASPYDGEPQQAEMITRSKSLSVDQPAEAQATEAAADDAEPKSLGEYELLSKLGEGGMGAVYKARQTRLDKLVAIKVLPKARTGDPQARARFEREMRAVGRVSHPNIVQAHDARDIEGTTILVMEFADGKDLSQIVGRQGALPIADACEVIRQAAVGLQCAHQNGLVHRDIKPSNLMLTQQGVVKILDLGLARLGPEHGGGGELTSEGQAMGTADYIAPEQTTDSHAVDIRADIYSLGCTLYKLLTGHAPYSGPKYDNPIKKMFAHLQEPIPSVRDARGDVPAELAAILERMMAKDREGRYATPAEVAEALAPFTAGCHLERLTMEEGIETLAPRAGITAPGITAPQVAAPRKDSRPVPAPLPQPAPRRTKPRTIAVALGCLGLVILLGIVIRIRDKSGKETLIPVPDGAQVTIEEDGSGKGAKPVQRGESAGAQPTAAATPAVDPMAPPVLADKANPFVVLHADGKRDEFKHFANVLSVLQAGDAIEVYGNGPFRLPQIVLREKGLTLRAGTGYRPRFVSADFEGEAWFEVRGPLAIQGCDFWITQKGGFYGGAGPWEFRNCRIARSASSASSSIRFGDGRLLVTDCLLSSYENTSWLEIAPHAEVELSNNILEASTTEKAPITLLGSDDGDQRQALRLNHNTVLLQNANGVLIHVCGKRKGGMPVEIETVGNAFVQEVPLLHCDIADPVGVIRWKGRDNLYAGLLALTCEQPAGGRSEVAKGLAAWNKFWGSDEPGSKELPTVRFSWQESLYQDSAAVQKSMRQVCDDLRRQHAAKLNDGVGPDWDLVGSGAAYVRALAAAGKPVATAALRPDPPESGSFVLLRADKVLQGYLTLQQATDAAASGDVVEIRSDGPVAGCRVSPPPQGVKSLVIRSAPGYRALLEGGIVFDEGTELTVEGIHFHNVGLHGCPTLEGDKGGRLVRLANCEFDGAFSSHVNFPRAVTAIAGTKDGQPVEIAGCLIGGDVLVAVPEGRTLNLHQSYLGHLQIILPRTAPRQVKLDRCMIGATRDCPQPVALGGWVGEGQFSVSASRTIFALPGPLSGWQNASKISAWRGERNVFCLRHCRWTYDHQPQHWTVGLEAWQKQRQTDTDSIEVDSPIYAPRRWRLLSSSPGYHAGPDGKDFGADVDRVAVVKPESALPPATKTSGEKPAVPAKSEPAALADKEKPFVLLHADGKRDEFKHLSGALAVLQGGDAIEVYGNGPFLVPILRLTKGLTLRAALGYRPRFELTKPEDNRGAMDVRGPLSVVGCDLIMREPQSMITGGGGSCEFRGCRFFSPCSGPFVEWVDAQTLAVRDCLSLNRGILSHAKSIELSNNIVYFGIHLANPVVASISARSIRLLNNTIVFGHPHHRVLSVSAGDAASGVSPATVEAAGNLFWTENLVDSSLPPDKCKEVLIWRGQDNLYVDTKCFITHHGEAGGIKGFSGWKQLMGGETGSLCVERVAFQPAVLTDAAPDAALAWLQKRAAAVRRQVGSRVKDWGPRWELVGPGDAYVRALAEAGHPVPPGQMRPDAPEDGPFVLVRQGKVVRGFPSLAQALPATNDGDTLEIRTDGPVAGVLTDDTAPPTRAVTLRAAPGYRPVVSGEVYIGSGFLLTVEGLDIRNGSLEVNRSGKPGCGVARLANCSFSGRQPSRLVAATLRTMTADRRVHIDNCFLPICANSTASNLEVRNSIIFYIWPASEDPDDKKRVELRHSMVGWPGIADDPRPEAFLIGQAAIVSQATLFDAVSATWQKEQDFRSWQGSGNVYATAMSRPSLAQLRADKSQDEGSVEADPAVFDPTIWRLLSSSPGYRAGPGGKDFGADVDRVAVVQPTTAPPSAATTAGEKPESSAKPEPAPLADKEKPFVLIHADGKRDEFKHLLGAVAVLQAGDAIEVYGNGPFLLGQVVLKDKPLTLRAAPGYRPRFIEREGTSDRWFDLPGVALNIEGCDFQNFGRHGFVGGGQPWKIGNCCIVRAAMSSGATFIYDGPELVIRDSFLSAVARNNFTTIQLGPKAALDVSNSVIESDWGSVIAVSWEGQTVRLKNNLFFGSVLTTGLSELKKDVQPVQFDVRGNVFRSCGINIHADALAQSLVRWNGENNLYTKRTLSTIPGTEQPQGTPPKGSPASTGLAGWKQLCKSEEAGSKEIDDVQFRFGRLRWQSSEATIREVRQIVADLRRSGRSKADFGPNADLLGPGDAYLRALAAAGKPVPKEQLRPESAEGGPCVLIRAGQVVLGYVSLQQAADAVQNGDVIEIRSDGPLKGCSIYRPTPERPMSLAVRAAPGYRPVLTGSLEFSAGTELTVEGFHFQNAGLIGANPHPVRNGGLVRLANCSFEGQFPDIYPGIIAPNGVRAVNAGAVSAEGKPAEIVNCLIPGSFRTSLNGSGTLHVTNSLVDSIDFYQSPAPRLTVNFEHSAVIGLYGMYGECATTKTELQVSARSTLFDLTGALIERHVQFDLVSWKGEANVYRLRPWPWCQVLGPGTENTVRLEAWQKRWQSDADSSEADPSIYDPRQWQLLPRTPGEYQGPDGRDFGPDMERIGAATTGSEKAGVETFPRRSKTPPSPGGDGDRRVAK